MPNFTILQTGKYAHKKGIKNTRKLTIRTGKTFNQYRETKKIGTKQTGWVQMIRIY